MVGPDGPVDGGLGPCAGPLARNMTHVLDRLITPRLRTSRSGRSGC